MSEEAAKPSATSTEKKSFLPAIGSWKYHVLLGSVAIFILGPLGGITASYMNFSLGFFVGGQVLAGILGSVITYGYGSEGKHGANFMQTMAASVASMAAMGVLIQAMVWLGLPIPPAWQLVIYFLCVGMFGVGVGMLFTPILVDRLQLTYPSGLAVANILRALTDKRLLKRSVGQLAAGTGIGISIGILVEKSEKWLASVPFLATNVPKLSASSFGAGMVVGSRIGIPAITIGVLGDQLTPWLRAQHLLGPEEPFRKVTFLVALGAIMGAAIIDLSLIFYSVVQRVREYLNKPKDAAPPPESEKEEWKKFNTKRLLLWTATWGVGVALAAIFIMKLPVFFVLFALGLTFIFIIINGISTGVSDSNPISSAFVVTVLLMTAIGLKDPGIGLLAAAILLVAVSVGVDMQQDRSTGWRLGSNRRTQFRYQVVGVSMGAVMAVAMATVFMEAYPSLKNNSFDHAALKDPHWQSAMTYKFVGALRGITNPNPTKTKLLAIGLGIGFGLELIRKIVKTREGYKRFVKSGPVGFVFDWTFDAILVPSPYAASFGGFVELATSINFGVGGVVGSLWQAAGKQLAKSKPKKDEKEELPEDMSTTSLVGGGFIAGESISALILGIIGLVATLTGTKAAKLEPTLVEPSLKVTGSGESPVVVGDMKLVLKSGADTKVGLKAVSLENESGGVLIDALPAQLATDVACEEDAACGEGKKCLPEKICEREPFAVSGSTPLEILVHVDSTRIPQKEDTPKLPNYEDLCGKDGKERKLRLWVAVESGTGESKMPLPAETEPFTPVCGE